MKKIIFIICLVFLSISINAQVCDKWVLSYLPTYQQDGSGAVSFMTSTDFSRLTYIGHHGPVVNTNGTLNMASNGATSLRLSGAVNRAHLENKPILLSIVLWIDYITAISTVPLRTTLINRFNTYTIVKY